MMAAVVKDIKSIWKQSNIWDKLAFIIVGMTILGLILFMEYIDTPELLNCTHKEWDLLISGKLLNIYDGSGNLGLTINLIDRFWLLIWYLPSWLLGKLVGSDSYITYPYHLWHMLFSMILFAICMYAYTDMVKHIKGDMKELQSILLSLASPIVMISVFYSGQNEIGYITLFLLALMYYVRGDRKRFYIFMILSAISCQIMLVPYLIFILMEDKKIYSILGKLIIPMVPQFIYDIVFSHSLSYRYLPSVDMFSRFFEGDAISINAIVLIIIMFRAYFYKASDGKVEYISQYAFLTAIAMGTLEIVAVDNFYRRFLWIIPALVYVATVDSIRGRLEILVINIVSIFQALLYLSQEGLITARRSGRVTPLTELIIGQPKNYYDILLHFDDMDFMWRMINSVVVAGFVLFILLGMVNEEKIKKLDLKKESSLVSYMALGSVLIVPMMVIYALVKAYL